MSTQLPDGERRNQATRAAVMLTYGKLALRAPKTELLACVEKCILANILELFRACRTKVGAWGTEEGAGRAGCPHVPRWTASF